MTRGEYRGPGAMVGDGWFQAYQCKGSEAGEPSGPVQLEEEALGFEDRQVWGASLRIPWVSVDILA